THLDHNLALGGLQRQRIFGFRHVTPFHTTNRLMVSRRSALDSCLLDIIHARKLLRQIGIALVLDAALIGPAAPRRALAIFGIESIHYVHPRYDPAERCKARLVE